MSQRGVFTDAEFNSNDGMLTSVWGPALWHTLHTMSFNYPTSPTRLQKDQYRDFMLSLGNVLPCGACRKNLIKNLKEVPLTEYALSNRKTFSRWMWRLHEQVNTMLDKKSGLSYDDVAARYENFRARCLDAPKRGAENGGVEPLTGVKSKCVIKIVPKTTKCPTFSMDKTCQVSRDEDKHRSLPAMRKRKP